MSTLREQIDALMSAHGDLSAYGWAFRNRYGWNTGSEFERNRAQMLKADFERQVAVCLAWLLEHRIPRGAGSYGAKHRVENDVGVYVSNGALITAALLAGYAVDRDFNSPNCGFALGKAVAGAC